MTGALLHLFPPASYRKQKECGCVADDAGRKFWKHVGPGGLPETAMCERFGGCSHPCDHKIKRTK